MTTSSACSISLLRATSPSSLSLVSASLRDRRTSSRSSAPARVASSCSRYVESIASCATWISSRRVTNEDRRSRTWRSNSRDSRRPAASARSLERPSSRCSISLDAAPRVADVRRTPPRVVTVASPRRPPSLEASRVPLGQWPRARRVRAPSRPLPRATAALAQGQESSSSWRSARSVPRRHSTRSLRVTSSSRRERSRRSSPSSRATPPDAAASFDAARFSR
jgi:hypothetical protein